MSNQITGRLVWVGQTFQIPSKTGGAPFLKREFLLDTTTYDPYTGQRNEYENILPLEVSGDKCTELDQFKIGDAITVSFALQGRSWTNQDGELKRMASIRCYKLEVRRTTSQPVAQPVNNPTAQQPMPPQTDGRPPMGYEQNVPPTLK